MSWWLNLYFGEGPGIAKDAPQPKGLRRIWACLAREWWSLILLNLLFAAAALPLVTLPAALAAMLRVTATMVKDEPLDLWHEFRTTFTRRFWQASLTGTGFALVLALSAFVTRFYATAATDHLLLVLPMAVAGSVTLFLTMTGLAAMALTATSRAGPATLIRAAALTVLLRPLPILAALGANAGLWLAHIAFYPSTVLLAVTINFSLGALLLSFAVLETAQTSLGHIRRGEAEQPEETPDQPARIQPT